MPNDSASDSFKRLFKRQDETSPPEQPEHKINPPEVKGAPHRRIIQVEPNEPSLPAGKPDSQQDNIKNITTDIKSAQSGTQKKETLFKKAEQEIFPLQEKYQAASNYQQDLENRLTEQQNLMQKLLEEQQVFNQRIQVNMSEKDKITASIKNLTELIIPQQLQQAKKTENEIGQAQIEAQRRQVILANLLREITKQKSTLQALQAKESELKNAHQEAKNRWGILTETLWQLEREINQKASEHQHLRNSISQSENTIAQYGQLLDRTGKSIQMTESEAAKRQQELALFSKEYSPAELSTPGKQKQINAFDADANILKTIFWVLFGCVATGLVGITIWQIIVRIAQKQ